MKIKTRRLLLNRFKESDSQTVCQLAGDKKISQWTATIPHPYPEHEALKWIQAQALKKHIDFFAIRYHENLIGQLSIERSQDQGFIGYWIGRPFQRKGLGAEACSASIQFGFETRKLRQIKAIINVGNLPSQRMVEKIGMKNEGIIKKFYERDGERFDVFVYSIS